MYVQEDKTDTEVEHMIEERIQKRDKLKHSLKILKVSLSVFTNEMNLNIISKYISLLNISSTLNVTKYEYLIQNE